MDSEHKDHALEIASWISRSGHGLPTSRRLRFFTQTFNTLLGRVEFVLGPVVLMAILERILYDGRQRYPFLPALHPASFGTKLGPLRGRISQIKDADLDEAFTFLFTAFFSIIDRISGEILTPAIYNVLLRTSTTSKDMENP